jgi:hypothetical protein
MAFRHFCESDGWRRLACADCRKLAPSQVQIFALVQVLDARFADVKGLGAPGGLRQFIEAAFPSAGSRMASMFRLPFW